MYDVKHTSSLFLVAAAMALPVIASGTLESEALKPSANDRALVRVTHHSDGSRSIYKRDRNKPGVRRITYVDGKLAAIHDYLKDKNGRLIGCTVSGPDQKPLYKVAYLTDAQGRICEEQFSELASGRLVQRIVYRTDAKAPCATPAFYGVNSQPLDAAKALPPTYDVNAILAPQGGEPGNPGETPRLSGE